MLAFFPRNPESARRGFIAAPLLGTLLFLICLMLIVALSRSEASRVDEIVSNAYHNRLISLVEIFRSDLGANFNLGLQRTIEYGLTSQCWFNFAPISTEHEASPYSDYTVYVDLNKDGSISDADVAELDQTFGAPDNAINETEERYHACRRMKELVRQVVCPATSGLGGLPSWVDSFKDPVTFEGVQFTLANPDVIPAFRGAASGPSICSRLAERSSFDCKNFATNAASPYLCCKEVDEYGECADTDGDGVSSGDPDEYVPGACANGDFLVPIDVTAADVFPYLPRLEASDTAGNKIRTGAISDENFQAPVAYPLFKYLDAAFVFNRFLAYGPDKAKLPVASETGVLRGVVPGACEGEAGANPFGCAIDSSFTPRLPASGDYGLSPNTVQVTIRNDAAQKFFERAVRPACTQVATKGVNTAFCPISGIAFACATQLDYDNDGQYCSSIPCLSPDPDDPYVVAPAGLNDCLTQPLSPEQAADQFDVAGVTCGLGLGGAPQYYCGDIDFMDSQIVFFDSDTTAQVDPLVPNTFCWLASSKYVP